ncbi:hypothetical protein A2U01_0031566, partial [Trifolium medium]|nr:hypothetical protein [Trifolium medium]
PEQISAALVDSDSDASTDDDVCGPTLIDRKNGVSALTFDSQD